MNLANNQDPLENTNYKFDNTRVVIRLPYEEYGIDHNINI